MLRTTLLRMFTTRVQLLALTLAAMSYSPGDAEIFFDDFTDDFQPYEYRLVPSPCCELIGGEVSLEDDGLVFVAESAAGVEVHANNAPLPESDSWSIRAELRVNELTNSFGLAGVGIINPERYAAVIAGLGRYRVGQGAEAQGPKINDSGEAGDEIFGASFVVQMDFTGGALTGHFWTPENPTFVTTVNHELELSSNPGPPRLANNGADITYRAIWLSEKMLPLPTGFEDAGDLDGNEIIEFGDIDLLAAQIRGDQEPRFDLNADGLVDLKDQSTLVEDFLGTQPGDADLDGVVAFPDFLTLSANFGGSGGWVEGDFDASGDITFSDFLILSNNFSPETKAAAVPEPTCIQVVFAAACCFVAFDRRRSRS